MIELFSLEAERRVLSTLWYSSESQSIESMVKNIPLKIFSDLNNRHIMEGIKILYPNRDSIRLQQWIKRKYPSSAVSNTVMEAYLDPNDASLLNLSNSVAYIKNLAFRRFSAELAREIISGAESDDTNIILSNSKAIGNMYRILTSKKDNLDMFRKAVENKIDVIPTAFKSLNQIMSGWSRREISSIGGKSGHHKTGFIVANACSSIKTGLMKKVHYISVEHPGDIIASRILASEFSISFRDLMEKKAIFNKEECYQFLRRTYGSSFVISDRVSTITSIVDAMRSNPADQHIIDHAQELSYYNNDMNNGISQLLLSCKEVAKEQNSNVLILSQVKDKEINIRLDSKVPKSHDFYNSSRIKQESRQLLVVHWNWNDYFEAGIEDVPLDYFNQLDVYCYKSTYTSTGKAKIWVDPICGQFKDIV